MNLYEFASLLDKNTNINEILIMILEENDKTNIISLGRLIEEKGQLFGYYIIENIKMEEAKVYVRFNQKQYDNFLAMF